MALRTISLFRTGCLVDLDVSVYRATARVSAEEVGTEPERVPAIVDLGRKHLFPPEVLEPVLQAESRARQVLARYSHVFPVAGLRYVPLKSLDELEEELQAAKKEFDDAVRSFLDNYETGKDAMMRQYPEVLRDSDYPDPRSLGFEMSWKKFVLAPVEGDGKDLDTIEDAMLQAAVRDLRSEVARKCRAVAAKLEAGEFSESNTKSLRNLVERFRRLNFVGDAQVEARLQELEQSLAEVPAKVLREYPPARERMKRCLDLCVEAAEGKDFSEVLGRFRRSIEVPDVTVAADNKPEGKVVG